MLCLVYDEQAFCALQPLHYHSKNHIPPFSLNAFVGGKRKQHVFKQAVELENEGLWGAAPHPTSCFRQELVGRCPTPRKGTSPLDPMKGGNVIFPAIALALAGS